MIEYPDHIVPDLWHTLKILPEKSEQILDLIIAITEELHELKYIADMYPVHAQMAQKRMKTVIENNPNLYYGTQEEK